MDYCINEEINKMKIINKLLKLGIWVGLIAFAVHLYQNDTSIQTAAKDSVAFLQTKVTQLVYPNSKSSANDDHNSTNNYTWSSNNATVYIDLDNQILYNAAVNAINSWNSTGAFTFKIVNSKKNANIIIKAMNDDSTNAAGLTSTSYNPVSHHLLKAVVKLNEYYLLNQWFGYDNQRIVNTAEHELGHAIGLSHTKEVSVMYPEGSYYTIQPRDISNVKQLYGENNQSSSSSSNAA